MHAVLGGIGSSCGGGKAKHGVTTSWTRKVPRTDCCAATSLLCFTLVRYTFLLAPVCTCDDTKPATYRDTVLPYHISLHAWCIPRDGLPHARQRSRSSVHPCAWHHLRCAHDGAQSRRRRARSKIQKKRRRLDREHLSHPRLGVLRIKRGELKR